VVPVRDKEIIAREEVSVRLRVGHLLRVSGYLTGASLFMWSGHARTEVAMGMAEASVRGHGPGGAGGPDEDLLRKLRDLLKEARWYLASGDFPAGAARMRVAEDLVALRIVSLSGE
jgi:hypothetical protein